MQRLFSHVKPSTDDGGDCDAQRWGSTCVLCSIPSCPSVQLQCISPSFKNAIVLFYSSAALNTRSQLQTIRAVESTHAYLASTSGVNAKLNPATTTGVGKDVPPIVTTT